MTDLFNNPTSPRPRIGTCAVCKDGIYAGSLHNCIKAKARAHDPATSHEAADKVEREGVAGAQRRRCLDLVRARPGMTAGEIQAELGFLAHKRLPELRQDGLIRNGEPRICSVNGTKQLTWWPTDDRAATPPFIDALGAVTE